MQGRAKELACPTQGWRLSTAPSWLHARTEGPPWVCLSGKEAAKGVADALVVTVQGVEPRKVVDEFSARVWFSGCFQAPLASRSGRNVQMPRFSGQGQGKAQ